jgi:mono/diheme cytochrome c family protein
MIKHGTASSRMVRMIQRNSSCRSIGGRAAIAVTAAITLAFVVAVNQPARAQGEGVGMFSVAKLKTTSGPEIYQHICQGCHMPDGKGAIGAGRYPALAGDGSLASAQFMAMTLLEGRRNMPAFGGNGDVGLFFSVPTLNDDQIAAVINYVRSSFGNHFKGRITAVEVKALRRPNNDKPEPAR